MRRRRRDELYYGMKRRSYGDADRRFESDYKKVLDAEIDELDRELRHEKRRRTPWDSDREKFIARLGYEPRGRLTPHEVKVLLQVFRESGLHVGSSLSTRSERRYCKARYHVR